MHPMSLTPVYIRWPLWNDGIGGHGACCSMHGKPFVSNDRARRRWSAITFNKMLASQPLPPNPYDSATHPEWHAAYAKCVDYEHTFAAQTGPNWDLIRARALGYFLIHAPLDTGRTHVAMDINSCDFEDELKSLGKLYVNFLGRACK